MSTPLAVPGGSSPCGSNGVQSGSESRMSTLMVPLNGFAIGYDQPRRGLASAQITTASIAMRTTDQTG